MCSRTPTCGGIVSCAQCRHASYSFAPCVRFGPDCRGCPHCCSDVYWPSAGWGRFNDNTPRCRERWPDPSDQFLYVPRSAFGYPKLEWCHTCAWAPCNIRPVRTHSDLSDDPALCLCGACAAARSEAVTQTRCECVRKFRAGKYKRMPRDACFWSWRPTCDCRACADPDT